MKRKNLIIAAAALFVIGLVSAGLVYKFVINKPHENYEKAKPAYIISAAELYNSFQANRAEAEKKYNGQVVLLKGRLDKVEASDTMVTGVFVFDQGMFGDEGIRCTMLPKYSPVLKAIPQGTDVQVKGFLTGYNDTDVILEECTVVL
jgi:hypothetical protein